MAEKFERIPLDWLIEQPKLMKPLWDQLSVPQQTLVKAVYGLPLTSTGEQKAWATFNGACEMDDLGFITSWHEIPYEPQEYSTVVGLIGRRAGKSQIMCFMLLYEVLFGGHLSHVGEDEDVVVPYLAQDIFTAKSNMRKIVSIAKQSPKLYKEITTDLKDKIQFRNGITVLPEPPNVKTGRGVAIPVLIMDEVAFWYKAAENANPDFEVLRALSAAQIQFGRWGKKFIISTPYTEEGLLWDYYLAGTNGQKLVRDEQSAYADTLVVQTSTAALENPRIVEHGRSVLQKEHDQDPESFPREFLARFVKSESNFLPGTVIDSCTDKGVLVRRRNEVEVGGLRPNYVACMDPAFRGDDFAFTIGHMDQRGRIVQDLLHVWSPDKKLGVKLDPSQIIWHVGQFLKQWNIPVCYSDQYQLESLQQLALQQGFSILGHDFTGQSKSKIYGSLEQLLKTQRIRLLDRTEIRQQLSQLNKKLTAGGNVQIGAPIGRKDDVATVTALMAHLALQHYPTFIQEKPQETVQAREIRKIKAKQKEPRWDSSLDW